MFAPETPEPDKETLLSLDSNARRALVASYRESLARQANRLRTEVRALGGSILIDQESDIASPIPVIRVVAPLGELRRIGDLDRVVAIGPTTDGTNEKPHSHCSSAYLGVDKIQALRELGHDGTGTRVIDILGTPGVGNTAELGMATGDCDPQNGPNYACLNPEKAPRAALDGHMQQVLGIIRNTRSDLQRGMANDTLCLAGNIAGEHGTTVVDAVSWAVNMVGNAGDLSLVINRSAANDSSTSRSLDYFAKVYPWPVVVASSGNDPDAPVGSLLANGLVVGASDDLGNSDPDYLAQMASFSSWMNVSNGAAGWELPHVVAPGQDVYTVPGTPGGSKRCVSGTSFAAPQVSGMAASLMDGYGIEGWPEAVFSILMASSVTVDNKALNLADSKDDADGAGNINGERARRIANAHRNGGELAGQGFDYGVVRATGVPAGSYYPETWTPDVPYNPGQARRIYASATFFNEPNCFLTGDPSDCTSRRKVYFRLRLYRNSSLVAESANFNGNYQYLSYIDGFYSTGKYELKIQVVDWQDIDLTTFGVAWLVD